MPTAAIVTVSQFAGVPMVSVSPTANPFALRTRTLRVPALMSALSAVRLDAVTDAVDIEPDLIAG